MARRGAKPYDGRIAVVSGASSGLGRRLAVDLAARGATVTDTEEQVADSITATETAASDPVRHLCGHEEFEPNC